MATWRHGEYGSLVISGVHQLRGSPSGQAAEHGFGTFSDTCTPRLAKAFIYDDLEMMPMCILSVFHRAASRCAVLAAAPRGQPVESGKSLTYCQRGLEVREMFPRSQCRLLYVVSLAAISIVSAKYSTGMDSCQAPKPGRRRTSGATPASQMCGSPMPRSRLAAPNHTSIVPDTGLGSL